MRVLILITSIDQTKGGPSRSVPLFVKGLDEIGVDVTFLVIESHNMNIHSLDGTGVELHVLPSNYKSKDLDLLVRNGKFDIIHSQSIWEPLFHQMCRIAEKYHIPYILTPRGTLEPWSLMHKKWKKRIARWLYQDEDLNRCSCIYTTADMEAKHIRELGFTKPICVIPNGIEISDYPCRCNASRVKKQILFLSRIHPKKGIEILLSVWKQLAPKYPEWSLLIVGNGDDGYINSLNEMIKSMSISSSTRIVPPVFGKEKVLLFHDSSIFILPSYSENFGMVIAEAMSCGLPVITTDNTPWGFLNETKTGWCVHLNESNLSRAIEDALSLSANELFQMGQLGSKIVHERFDYHYIANMNRDLYSWIIEGGTPPFFVSV